MDDWLCILILARHAVFQTLLPPAKIRGAENFCTILFDSFAGKVEVTPIEESWGKTIASNGRKRQPPRLGVSSDILLPLVVSLIG